MGAVLRSPPILRFRMIPRFQLERVAIECATPARMYEPRPTRRGLATLQAIDLQEVPAGSGLYAVSSREGCPAVKQREGLKRRPIGLRITGVRARVRIEGMSCSSPHLIRVLPPVTSRRVDTCNSSPRAAGSTAARLRAPRSDLEKAEAECPQPEPRLPACGFHVELTVAGALAERGTASAASTHRARQTKAGLGPAWGRPVGPAWPASSAQPQRPSPNRPYFTAPEVMPEMICRWKTVKSTTSGALMRRM